MAQFEIPESPTKYIYYMSNFLGVDYNNPMELNVKHSPKMENMIYKNGYLAKRNGIKIRKVFENQPVYGLWQYDVVDDPTYEEILIAHVGTKLYEVSKDFSTITQIRNDMPEHKTFGIYYDNYLFILTGSVALVYGKIGTSYSARPLSDYAYVPLTTTAIDVSNGNAAGVLVMPVNTLTPWRRNGYYGDGVTAVYHTDSLGTIDVNDIVVWVFDTTTMSYVQKIKGTHYTVDTNNSITFTPGNIPADARSAGYCNVYIQFKDTSSTFSSPIDKCTMACDIGTKAGGMDLVFSGNEDYPAMLFRTSHNFELNQEGPAPSLGVAKTCFYVPTTSYQANVGFQPIIGMMRISDSVLAILKRLTDSDSTIFYAEDKYQTNALYKTSMNVLAITPGSKSIGCLTKYSTVNLLDHNIFLSEQGVFETITGSASSTLERYASKHSNYINPKLLKEPNLDDAMCVGCDNWYYIFVNNKCYVGDVTVQTEQTNNTIPQYQWYLFTDMPTVTSTMRWNNEIYFGTSDGCICSFGNDFSDEYLDEDREITSKPVYCYWESRPIDFGYPTKAKTTKTLTLNYVVNNDTKFDFGYKTVEDKKVKSDTVNTKPKEFVFMEPRTLQIKEKIRKVMFVTYYIESKNDKDCEFDRISVTYTLQDKYRGV